MTLTAPPIYWLTEDEWQTHLDPDGHWDPQCSVTTKRGTRCQNHLFGGQVYTILEGRRYISQEDGDILHGETCPFHRYVQASK